MGNIRDVNYNKASGEKIREARLAKNLTEQELAYAIDPDNYEEVTKLIKYWERGNGFPNLEQLYKMSEVIDIDVNEIYYYKDNETQKTIGKRKRGPMTVKEYDRKRRRELMMEDLENFGPAIVYAIAFGMILIGPTRMIYALRWAWNTIVNFFVTIFTFGRG